jgi:zinc protease
MKGFSSMSSRTAFFSIHEVRRKKADPGSSYQFGKSGITDKETGFRINFLSPLCGEEKIVRNDVWDGVVCYIFILFLFAVFSFSAQAASVRVQEVVSPGGIKAWLVQDDKLPLIAMRFAFRGGVEQDPEDKQGLAELTMALLTQGAGPYDTEAFQQKLADQSIQLGFSASRDELRGALKTLRSSRGEAFKMLRLSVTEPRFDAEAFERARSQQMTAMKLEMGTASWQGRYALFAELFKGHPYFMRHFGTEKTLEGLTREDVRDFAVRHFARDNLLVAVTGDISSAELGKALDGIFAKLHAHAQLTAVGDAAWSSEKAAILVKRDGTQTDMLFAVPMMRRNDPDWYAADIVNYILGGGGFESRLMKDVRDKKGLTYGISTALAPMEHASLLIGQASTDNPKTGEAWQAVRDVWQELYEKGVADAEIAAAKDYLTGSLPIALTSLPAIAGILLEMQLEDLGRDYLDRYSTLIRRVSADDVKQVIQKWFDPSRVEVVFVGVPEGVDPTGVQEQTRE